MFPWLFVWSPQYHLPWSGAVTQDISPDTFFGAIPADAGDGIKEQEIFEHVSYGKQLDALNEVTALLLKHTAVQPNSASEQKAVDQLRENRRKIEAVKTRYRQRDIDNAVKALGELKRSDPQRFQKIVAQLQTA